MNELTRAFLYSMAVVVSAVLGGWFPLRYRADPRRLDFLLAASAGILVGIIGLHLLPESLEDGGAQAIWWMIGGYVFLYVIERYLLPRSFHHLPHTEPPSAQSPEASESQFSESERESASSRRSEQRALQSSELSPALSPDSPDSPDSPGLDEPLGLGAEAGLRGSEREFSEAGRSPSRNTAGLGAYLGLALHTITDGIALGAAMEDLRLAPYVLLAIILHKIPSAFALSSVLVKARVPASLVILASGSLGFMVALGAIGFRLASHVGEFDALAFTPYAVAFSAGSFIHVTIADLLPDLQHSHTRRSHLLAALLLGLGLSVVLSSITPHH